MSTHEIVLVERLFEQPEPLERLQAAEDAVAWCLEQHRVRFLRSYVSLDGCSMVCAYEAPDAEAVRITQEKGGLPLVRAWTGRPLFPPTRFAAGAGRSTVAVERELPVAMAPEEVLAVMREKGGCLSLHGVEKLVNYLSLDGRRMFCIFEAPDAEAVRISNRQMGLPVARAWTATVHEAEAPDRA